MQRSEKYVQNCFDNHHICCATCKYFINDEYETCKMTEDKSDNCFSGAGNIISHKINDEIWTGKYSNKYRLWKLKESNNFKKLNDDLFMI